MIESGVMDRVGAETIGVAHVPASREVIRYSQRRASTYDQNISPDEHQEQYQWSLRALRLVGEAALLGCEADIDHPLMAEAYADLETGLAECLVADEEFGEALHYNPMQQYDLVEGCAVDRSGRSLKEMVLTGYVTSLEASNTNPEMLIQAERDYGDVLVVEKVEQLQPGGFLAVISVEPKDAIKNNVTFWEDEMNYREGIAVLQIYYRPQIGNVIFAGAQSVRGSDLVSLRQIFSEHGTYIPAEESENRYIRHGITYEDITLEQAENFSGNFIKRYKKIIGDDKISISATDLIKRNKPIVQNYFQTYIVPLMQANVGNQGSNLALQSLASAMLGSPVKYRPEDQDSLLRIAQGSTPNDTDTKVMIQKIQYALLEELRKSLKPDAKRTTPVHGINPHMIKPTPVLDRELEWQIAQNIVVGTKAGREYGGTGCIGSNGAEKSVDDMFSDKQDVFGGHGNLPDDMYGSRYFTCPRKTCGFKNVREKKNELLTHCKGCKKEIPKC